MEISCNVLFAENTFNHNVKSTKDPEELLTTVCFRFGRSTKRCTGDVLTSDFCIDVVSHHSRALESNFVSIGTDDSTVFREAMAGPNSHN